MVMVVMIAVAMIGMVVIAMLVTCLVMLMASALGCASAVGMSAGCRWTLCHLTLHRVRALRDAMRCMSVPGVVGFRRVLVTRRLRPSSMIVSVMMCGHGARA